MNAKFRDALRLGVLVLLLAPASLADLSGGTGTDYFFPDGTDYWHYDPDGGPQHCGRIYVGEHFGHADCHYRVDLECGDSGRLTEIKITYATVGGDVRYTNSSGSLHYVEFGQFKRFDKEGHLCPDTAAPKVAAAAVAGSIHVSNDADTFDVSCDRRHAVVVGSNGTAPVSLVDLSSNAEVDTFAHTGVGSFVACCDDGESALVLFNGSQLFDSEIVRLKVTSTGRLVGTGDIFAAGGPYSSIRKVFAVPGSKIGVALGNDSDVAGPAAYLVTFSIPGLHALDWAKLAGTNELSAAVACDGTKVYARSDDKIEGFTLDPVTGALGDAASLTIPGVAIAYLPNHFGNTLAVSRDGARLIAAEQGASAQITYFDSTTGARVGKFEGADLGVPSLLGVPRCCLQGPPSIQHTFVLQKGDAAPGAGALGGPPPDATISAFGAPAIDDAGALAFTASWTDGARRGAGIFTDQRAVAITGGPVPGVPGATFKGFTDPLIEVGKVVFLATLRGVPKSAARAVLSDAPTGALAVIARTGDVAPDTGGAKFKAFRQVALDGAAVAFVGELVAGKGTAVTLSNDVGIWAQDATHRLKIVLREGQTIGNFTVQSFNAFLPGESSPGQGRGWVTASAVPHVLALVRFFGGHDVVLSADIDGGVTAVSGTSGNFAAQPDMAGAAFAKYGLPATTGDGHTVFAASLIGDGVTTLDARGVFLVAPGAPFATLIARGGHPAGPTEGAFATFGDPVLADDGELAFAATLRGVKGLAKSTLWRHTPGGALELLAQGGSRPPDTREGAQWRTFSSLAVVAGRGPLFAAKMVPGRGRVTAATASGVWATATDGSLRLLFRAGGADGERTLESFSALEAATGCEGSTRSFNASGQVAWRATFDDKSSAIVVTQIP